MKILVSPYSARLWNGNISPKSYPHWNKLVGILVHEGYEVIQIGVQGEERIPGVGQFIIGWPFDKLRVLMNDCATFVSVDNWWPHFCHFHRLKPGVVLFGPSDDRIFGYPENTNLLRGRDFLRPNQYQSWTEWQHNPLGFVYAENAAQAVFKLAPLPLAVSAKKTVYNGIW